MNTMNMTREQISAFLDGELDDSQIDAVLASLRQQEGRAAWDGYHQIGDALRSDELNVPLSADFNQRMFARLDDEPVIMMPAVHQDVVARKSAAKRFAMPGMAAAAVAVVAFLTVPNMLPQQTATVASAPQASPVVAQVAAVSEPVAAAAQEGEVLRDPRIDDYLLAHQRFSPSVYSTAQYARSATFAVDSEK
ncbi:sigma-E factor negative regulatory protein [uncultured Oxalicibacterium sp.]|uniref:sigma-E factor negative regulatory protein n=1 Tax=uncultured Oxalicibacterium sp. TaxID=1168540 RepID=UPI0025EFAA57|nr:sigma-E factor negative regulatory protein [uncultured Oxalicibacterium sp.]